MQPTIMRVLHSNTVWKAVVDILAECILCERH